MRYFFLLVLAMSAGLTGMSSWAESRDSLRISFAKSSETDLVTVVIGDYEASQESNYIVDAAWGRQLSNSMFGLPFPITANLGLQYLAERGYQADGVGGAAFVKANYDWKLPLTSTYVRLGLGEGLSYVSRVPVSEQRDFARKGVESSKLMNYPEWTIDVPLRQFTQGSQSPAGGIEDISLGFIVWRRSSVFGLFADSGGGVNFMGLTLQSRF